MTYAVRKPSKYAKDAVARREAVLGAVDDLAQAWSDANPKAKELSLEFVAGLIMVGKHVGLSDSDVREALA